MAKINLDKIKKAGDYIRYLSLFGIESAKSGHPGLPLGCADLGVILYRYLMKHNANCPQWANRDRFVLSAGHGSILLYSLLHCAGYKISLNDLANFRQLGSVTAGHPEYDIGLGIETTTGPLGQGIANAVGIAIEGKMLASRFNKDGFNLFDYTVYTLLGDGCNMEGISYEAGSIAGHLGLDNLIAIYDSNQITIDGSTDITFTEDVGKRYEALGWHVEHADASMLDDFYHKASKLKELKGKPKLLIVKTTIGEGLNKLRGSNKVHGAPTGIDEIAYFIQKSSIKGLFEKACGGGLIENDEELKKICQENILRRTMPIDSDEDCAFIREADLENGKVLESWNKKLDEYGKKFPEESKMLKSFLDFHVPTGLKAKLLNYKEEKIDATRGISGRILNICAEELPQIVGGSADLVESTKATVKSSKYIQRNDFSGRNIAFGIREHAMGAIGNGLALNRVLYPFTSTFFTFFDYMKPAVRLSAIMQLKHLFVFTHDSFYVGEDGPTHQPIEHLNSLRLIPDIHVFRPANPIETAFSYLYYLEETKGPVAILCTRQNISEEVLRFDGERKELYAAFKKGAYIIYETQKSKKPDIILGASGSEVGLAIEAAKLLEQRDKKNVRVISIPCLELFQQSEESYQAGLLANDEVPFVYIEAASYRGVRLFHGKNTCVIGIDHFGFSGPANKVAEKIGFTPEGIYSKIKACGAR